MKIHRHRIVPSIVLSLSLLAALGSWAASSQAANYAVYTNETAWTNAALQVREALHSTSIVTFSDLSGYGLPGDYYLYDQKDLVPLQTPAPLTWAFGGNFDLTPGGPGGDALDFLIKFADSTTAVVSINYPGGFLGITSDTIINSIEPFSSSNAGNGENFNYELLALKFTPNVCLNCRPIVR
jgi:hypothetical protein